MSLTPTVDEVLRALEAQAPLAFAESWDNVGLLVEPGPASSPLTHCLLTIDLDARVLAEAEARGSTLIVAYHPPIFSGFKRLRASVPAESIILRCAARGIFVYSPHTALDAAPGGLNDWLLDALDPERTGARSPCLPHPLNAAYGRGKQVTLAEAITVPRAIERIKAQLSLTRVRVALAPAHEAGAPITQFTVCAGAGGSVVERAPASELYLTGELRHHDILALRARGASVIVCDHSNTERGFLALLAERLRASCGAGITFEVAECDREPLRIV